MSDCSLADRRCETTVTDKEKVEIRTRRQRNIGGRQHLIESAAVRKLAAKDGNWRLGGQAVTSSNGVSIRCFDLRRLPPNRCDHHALVGAELEFPAQVIRVSGQSADDLIKTFEQCLLPSARDA